MVAAMAAVIYDMVMGLIDPPACGNVNNQTAKSFFAPCNIHSSSDSRVSLGEIKIQER